MSVLEAPEIPQWELWRFLFNSMLYSSSLTTAAPQIKTGPDGRKYLVVPGVPVREQVMNNYMVPAAEIAKFVGAWNGRPVTIHHPKTNDGSANAPEPDVQVIGRFYNANWNESKKQLEGEYWLDLNELRKSAFGKYIEGTVQNGKMLETSTGYYADEEATPGIFEGKAYQTIHRNLRPDHIAILPDEIGACSLSDGCGVNRNGQKVCQNKECPLMTNQNVRTSARQPSYEGTEDTSWADVPKTLNAFAEAWVKHGGGKMPEGGMPSKMEDMPKECIDWIASKTLLGDPSSDNPEDVMRFPVVNPNTGKLNAGALRAVLSGRGAQANIPANALESARNMAKSLLESEFKTKENHMNFESLKNLLKGKGLNLKTQANAESGETDFVIEDAPKQNQAQTQTEFPLNEKEIAALKSLATIADKIPAAIQMAQNAASMAEAEKTTVIEKIKANQANVFADEELKAMSLPVLVKLNAQLNMDFSALGGAFQNTAQQEVTYTEMPSILLAAPVADQK